MTTDAQSAASSAAVAPLPDLASLSSEERQQWRLTGEVTRTPNPTPDEPAESSPAEPAEQVASTEVSRTAASEPASSRKKGNADSRKAELGAEIQALLKQRDELRRELATTPRPAPVPDAPPAAPSPAPEPGFPDYATWASQPANTERTFEDYLDARTDFRWQQHERARVEHETRTAQARSVNERAAAFVAIRDPLKAADPSVAAFLDAMPAPIDFLPAGAPETAGNRLAQEIYQSPHAKDALLYFGQRPEEVERFLRMTSSDQVVRAFGKLEAQWESAQPASPVTRPLTQTVTSAPPPPPSLTNRATAPTSEIDAALASGDFRRYKQLADARDIAARR